MNEQPLIYSQLRMSDHTLYENLCISSFRAESSRSRLPAIANLGTLDALPLELLHEILIHLDLCALTNFQHVDRRALHLLESLPQYKAITTHASSILRCIRAIGTRKWITYNILREKLYTSACEQCGDFGGYLYLLTCKRVCFLCLTTDKLYLPLLRSHAIRNFGLDRRTVETLPHMRVIGGVYSPNEKKIASSILVDYESALCAGISLHGSISAMQKHVLDVEAQRFQAFDTRAAAAPQGKVLRRPRTTDPPDAKSGNPFRFVAIARAPYLSRESHEVEWGSYCIGCRKSQRLPFHWRRKFSAASFVDHLRECGNIQNGKHCLG